MLPSQGFFEISAQVIPLMFITLAIEHRMFSRVDYYDQENESVNPFFSLSVLVAMGLLIVGEWFALDALWDDGPHRVNAEVVRGSLYFGAVGIIAPFVRTQLSAIWRSKPESKSNQAQWFFWVVFFVVVFVAILVGLFT